MREIGRDQMPDRSEIFKAGDQLFGKTRWRDEDQIAACKPKHAHAHRQAQTRNLMRAAIDDPDIFGDLFWRVEGRIGDRIHNKNGQLETARRLRIVDQLSVAR